MLLRTFSARARFSQRYSSCYKLSISTIRSFTDGRSVAQLKLGTGHTVASHNISNKTVKMPRTNDTLESRKMMFSTTSDSSSHYTDTQKRIMEECAKLHASIMPLNEQLAGPLAAQSNRDTALPFVLLVGNHSSGKSSFINYILGRNIQTAGVAPTDDNFTIVAPGNHDVNQDGPSLVGDPDWGFEGLRQFGPTLLHHTQLKIRKDIDSNFILVDSPGMIDAPSSFSGMLLDPQHRNPHQYNNPSSSPAAAGIPYSQSSMDRGYDFTGVVRWLANRADIVLLFFDPDKPGTTGETLSVLLNALSGMDHKLLIILNKADQFHRIHDFARAYGSLCWNLSKVIPRKDLPRIYTMCLPNVEQGSDVGKENNTSSATTIPPGLADLHTARDEVVAEVRQAPARRLDNVLTSLYDAVQQLTMYAKLLSHIQERYQQYSRSLLWPPLATGLSGTLLTAGLLSSETSFLGISVPPAVTGGVVASTIVLTGGLVWYGSIQRDEWKRTVSSDDNLTAAFTKVYAREISQGDEYMAALWQSRVRDALYLALERDGLANLTKPSASDLDRLNNMVDNDIPKLRRQVAPTHMGK